jgi:hypothetical protein
VQGCGEAAACAARPGCAAQMLGRRLLAQATGALVDENERVARIAGQHR